MGAKVIEQIASDLQQQLPGLKGFSYRNLMKMRHFFNEYQLVIFLPSLTAELENAYQKSIVQSVTAQLQTETKTNAIPSIRPSATAQLNISGFTEHFFGISFTHHILLLNKCKTLEERFFYIEQASARFWSVSLFEHQIDAGLYAHQGKLPNNFSATIQEQLKPSALQVFQDEYLLDFITSDGTEDERVLEARVVSDIKNFILRMGKGFSFIGNQYRLEVEGEEFFVDLLFFNRHLQCLVAFELKRGKFKPEYAGQLNFYLNVLDDKIKLPHENPSIGIVLCKEKNNTVVEISVRNIDKAMGVATYRTSKEVPREMKGILPNADDLARLL